jgi:hypothetical protein
MRRHAFVVQHPRPRDLAAEPCAEIAFAPSRLDGVLVIQLDLRHEQPRVAPRRRVVVTVPIVRGIGGQVSACSAVETCLRRRQRVPDHRSVCAAEQRARRFERRQRFKTPRRVTREDFDRALRVRGSGFGV